jgi:serine/threonine protein kinase
MVMELIRQTGAEHAKASAQKGADLHPRMSTSWRTKVAMLLQLAKSMHDLHEKARVLHGGFMINNWGTLQENKLAVLIDFELSEELGNVLSRVGHNMAEVHYHSFSCSIEAKPVYWHAPERLIAPPMPADFAPMVTAGPEVRQVGDDGWLPPNTWIEVYNHPSGPPHLWLPGWVEHCELPSDRDYVQGMPYLCTILLKIPNTFGRCKLKPMPYDPKTMRLVPKAKQFPWQWLIAEKKVKIGPASDWYSYGIGMVELLCGHEQNCGDDRKHVTKTSTDPKWEQRVFNSDFDFKETEFYQAACEVDGKFALEISTLVCDLLKKDEGSRPPGGEVVARLQRMHTHCKKKSATKHRTASKRRREEGE